MCQELLRVFKGEDASGCYDYEGYMLGGISRIGFFWWLGLNASEVGAFEVQCFA